MSELTGPAEIHNGLALYQRGQGYPLLANAIPARLGRALETAAFCARQAPPGGPDDGVPGNSPSLVVAECLGPVTGG